MQDLSLQPLQGSVTTSVIGFGCRLLGVKLLKNTGGELVLPRK